ncbi:MAG TPA: hypothetical protein VNO22_09495 [Planctomycetota bacterium]|jgi:hypothetical protein|nr:hypothetical protein [Planctomycetota bacterium]
MSADPRFDDLVSAYFDGSLDPAGLEELNAGLSADPMKARRFVLLSRIHASLRELQSPAGELPTRRRRWAAAVPSAALAAAALLALVFMLFPSERLIGPTVGAPGAPETLLVTGRVDPALTPGDAAVRDRLVQLGFRVIPAKEDAVTPELARSRALVVISESVRSDRIGGRLRAVPVPILNCEPHLNVALGLSREPDGPPPHFTKTYRFRIRILAPEHPLAAGLRDRVRVYHAPGTVGWGLPVESAVRVAVLDDDETQTALFACETSAPGPEQRFPARRVSFFLSDYTSDATLLTPEGWRLFDAAVSWLTGR